MSEQAGEKTEQPTQRKLDEAVKNGQIARSNEIQTVFVAMGGLAALMFTGREMWGLMAMNLTEMLGHLHDTPLSEATVPSYAVKVTMVMGQCVWPVVVGTSLAGLVAGGIQNRFQTASEALTTKWERINPVNGFQRIFSVRALVPAVMSLLKLAAIAGLSYSEIVAVFNDPIFLTAVSLDRIASFLAGSCMRISLRVVMVLAGIAALDYAWQWWRNHRELMMTREEVKDEMKNTEGNPQVKAAQRRRAVASKRKMLASVPTADVVVTNPTHIAIALKYDRKKMKAPIIVAKGIRLNALRIREIAKQHQIPILENKPLARIMFKYGRVGGEIPAQVYAAVAEVLAWVYRTNRYRYFAEENRA